MFHIKMVLYAFLFLLPFVFCSIHLWEECNQVRKGDNFRMNQSTWLILRV